MALDFLRLTTGEDEATPAVAEPSTATPQAKRTRSWIDDAFASNQGEEVSNAFAEEERGLLAARRQNMDVPLFGLDVDSAFEDQAGLMVERQIAEEALTEKKIILSSAGLVEGDAILDQAFAERERTRQSQLAILGGLDDAVAKANRAIELSNSDNPLDRLSLWALQQADPMYTREGNVARMQYYQAASVALGERGLIQQEGFADQLSEIEREISQTTLLDENELALLALRETQGAERIEAAKQLAAARLGIMQATDQAQTLAVQNLQPEELANAAKEAIANGGSVSIMGVDVPLAKIQERDDAMQERNFLMMQMQMNKETLVMENQTLDSLNMKIAEAQASPDQTAIIGGVPISLPRLEEAKRNRIMAQTNADVQQINLNNMLTTQLVQTQDRVLATYDTDELTRLKSQGGYAEGLDMPFPIELIDKHLRSKAEVTSGVIAQQLDLANLGDPSTAITNISDMYDSVQAPPGSTLEKQILTNKGALNFVASTLLDPENPPSAMTKAQLAEALTMMPGTLQEQVKAFVASQPGAQDDPNMQAAYYAKFMGQPVPQAAVITGLGESIHKDGNVIKWLDPAKAAVFGNAYYESLMLQEENPATKGIGEAAQRAEAVLAGIKAVQANSNITADVFGSLQTRAPNFPIKPTLMSGNQFLNIMAQTETQADLTYQSSKGLSDEQMADVMSGRDPNAYAELEQLRAAGLYTGLEKVQPGLGEAYTRWWNTPDAPTYLATYMGARNAKATTIQESSELAILTPGVMTFGQNYGNVLDNAKGALFNTQMQTEHANFVTFGQNPQTKQVFLLQVDKTLTDAERQTAMSQIIQPLLTEASAAGLETPGDVAMLIEQRLRQMSSTPGVPNGPLINKMLKGRDVALGIADDFLALQVRQNTIAQNSMIGSPVGAMVAPLLQQMGAFPVDVNVKGVKWWEDMQGDL